MTRISDLLSSGPTTSFEFFPPQTDKGDATLRACLRELQPLEPSFVSVTYGAGGSTRSRTHRIVVDLLGTPMIPMAHLTTWGHTTSELRAILIAYHEAGVHNILALRGDPPRDQPDLAVGDLAFATHLVELAREVGGDDFAIGVAAHPQGHPASSDHESDRRHQAVKLSLADFAITQFFFEAIDYVRLVDELDDLGCDTPILPGIMPVTNVSQIERFAALSGCPVPGSLAQRLHAVADDPDEVRHIGIEHATALCADLLDAGAPGLHFYTLNRSTSTREIHANLNGRPSIVA